MLGLRFNTLKTAEVAIKTFFQRTHLYTINTGKSKSVLPPVNNQNKNYQHCVHKTTKRSSPAYKDACVTQCPNCTESRITKTSD